MRLKHSVLLLTAGFILMPTVLWSQPGGFGPPGGFGGAGGAAGGNADRTAAFFARMDPDQIFNMVAKGQEVIRVEGLDPVARSMFDRFATRFGITGNEITRDQFRESFNKIKEAAASGQLPQITGSSRMDGNQDRMFDSRFNDMDRNHDGVLSNDELNGHPLQDERDRYDQDRDGFIDLNEYRAYAMARVGGNMMGQQGQGDRRREGEDPDEARRPVVYRAGNLPRDFPYASLDENGDKDGQVGLYEWKNAGKRIAEFQGLDLNKDGFLTVDEYYRYRRQQMPQVASTSLFGDVPDPAVMMANGRGMRGGPGGDMRGSGGDMRGMGGDMRGQGGDRGTDFRSMMMSGDMGRGGMYPGMDMGRGRDGGREGRGPGGDMMMSRGPGGDTRGMGGDMRSQGGREGRGQGGEGMRMNITPGGDGTGMRMSFGPGGGGMTPGAPPALMPGAMPGGSGMFPGVYRDRGNGGGATFPGMSGPGGGKRDFGGGAGPGGGGPGGGKRDFGGGGKRDFGGGEGGGKRDFGGGGPRGGR